MLPAANVDPLNESPRRVSTARHGVIGTKRQPFDTAKLTELEVADWFSELVWMTTDPAVEPEVEENDICIVQLAPGESDVELVHEPPVCE